MSRINAFVAGVHLVKSQRRHEVHPLRDVPRVLLRSRIMTVVVVLNVCVAVLHPSLILCSAVVNLNRRAVCYLGRAFVVSSLCRWQCGSAKGCPLSMVGRGHRGCIAVLALSRQVRRHRHLARLVVFRGTWYSDVRYSNEQAERRHGCSYAWSEIKAKSAGLRHLPD
jgi:hypothetical protein